MKGFFIFFDEIFMNSYDNPAMSGINMRRDRNFPAIFQSLGMKENINNPLIPQSLQHPSMEIVGLLALRVTVTLVLEKAMGKVVFVVATRGLSRVDQAEEDGQESHPADGMTDGLKRDVFRA